MAFPRHAFALVFVLVGSALAQGPPILAPVSDAPILTPTLAPTVFGPIVSEPVSEPSVAPIASEPVSEPIMAPMASEPVSGPTAAPPTPVVSLPPSPSVDGPSPGPGPSGFEGVADKGGAFAIGSNLVILTFLGGVAIFA